MRADAYQSFTSRDELNEDELDILDDSNFIGFEKSMLITDGSGIANGYEKGENVDRVWVEEFFEDEVIDEYEHVSVILTFSEEDAEEYSISGLICQLLHGAIKTHAAFDLDNIDYRYEIPHNNPLQEGDVVELNNNMPADIVERKEDKNGLQRYKIEHIDGEKEIVSQLSVYKVYREESEYLD